jgi:hypothetical protein
MDAAQRSELETLARERMKEHGIPGVAIGILEGGGAAWIALS